MKRSEIKAGKVYNVKSVAYTPYRGTVHHGAMRFSRVMSDGRLRFWSVAVGVVLVSDSANVEALTMEGVTS